MKNKIYLCGGFFTDWQQSVSDSLIDDFIIYNPRQKEQGRKFTTEEYVEWDLFHIQKSDILLVRLESTNPSGIGMSVEVGYAKALNKKIIGVVDKNWEDDVRKRHFQFLVKCFDVVFYDKKEAINYLKMFK